MAENRSRDHVDDKCEGPVDIREADVQCVVDKDEHLGFVDGDGVIFEGFACEKGRLKAEVLCGDDKAEGIDSGE